jgi:hypothetical protein
MYAFLLLSQAKPMRRLIGSLGDPRAICSYLGCWFVREYQASLRVPNPNIRRIEG